MRPAALLAATLALVAAAAHADDATPVAIDAGATKNLCATGVVTCPVSSFLCDDPKVAVVETGSQGALLKGVAAGTTLCAVTGSAGTFRRVLRVTVSAPGSTGGGTPAR